jgi:hypothetical protein
MRFAGFLLVIALVFFSLFYPLYWHFKERSGKIVSDSRHSLFIRIIRVWLTLALCSYAFAKILGTQFANNQVVDNSLTKDLSGFELTWFYFQYSYPFSLTIALFQLLGATLLLFRRTVLPGIGILLPIMINIVLINVFYEINNAAATNAFFYTFGLLFLSSFYWSGIKQLIINSSKKLPARNLSNFVGLSLRLLIVSFSFFIVYVMAVTNSQNYLTGKWNIDTLIKGSDTIKANSWLTDSSAWTTVFMNEVDKVVLNPNPNMVDIRNASQGQYHYDSGSHLLSILIGSRNFVKDNFEFKVVRSDDKHMVWKGQYDGKYIQMNLTKE